MMSATDLFLPNNHSQWQVEWNAVGVDTRDEIIRAIQEGFGLQVQGDMFQSGAWEVRSNNFKTVVLFGTNDAREIVLKKNLAIHRVERIRMINQVIEQMAESDVPVPKIFHPHKTHAPVEWGGFLWEMFEYVPGDYFRGTEYELEEIAKCIARLHVALNRSPFAEEIKKNDKGSVAWDEESFTKQWKYVEEHVPKLFERYSSEFAMIDLCVRKAKSKKNELGFAQQGIVRNSLHPHDTLFKNEKCQAIIDFEEIGVSQLMREVASACHRFVRQYVIFQEKPWQQTLGKGLGIFLKGYFSENPKLRSEINLLPFFLFDELLRKLQYALKQLPNEEKQAIYEAEAHKFILLLKESIEIDKVLVDAIAHF